MNHGTFGRWLDAELHMCARTAQNYMNAARFLEGKSETVSFLPPTTIYLLAADSTPPQVVNEILADLETGSAPTSDDIRDRIAKVAKAQQMAAAARSAEQATRGKENEERRRAARAARERKRRKEEEASEARRESQASVVAEMLITRLGEDGVFQLLDGLRRTDWYRIVRQLEAMRAGGVV